MQVTNLEGTHGGESITDSPDGAPQNRLPPLESKPSLPPIQGSPRENGSHDPTLTNYSALPPTTLPALTLSGSDSQNSLPKKSITTSDIDSPIKEENQTGNQDDKTDGEDEVSLYRIILLVVTL